MSGIFTGWRDALSVFNAIYRKTANDAESDFDSRVRYFLRHGRNTKALSNTYSHPAGYGSGSARSTALPHFATVKLKHYWRQKTGFAITCGCALAVGVPTDSSALPKEQTAAKCTCSCDAGAGNGIKTDFTFLKRAAPGGVCSATNGKTCTYTAPDGKTKHGTLTDCGDKVEDKKSQVFNPAEPSVDPGLTRPPGVRDPQTPPTASPR